MMNAYKLNEYETWSGNTAEEAIKAAIDHTGVSREDMVDDDYFSGDPESRDIVVRSDEWPNKTITIGEILDGMTEPGFVCGTEC